MTMKNVCCKERFGWFNISVLLKFSWSGNFLLFSRFASKPTDVENRLKETTSLSDYHDCSDIPQDIPDATSWNKVITSHSFLFICVHEFTNERLMKLHFIICTALNGM
jgi:hypothetical protein